MNVYMMAGAGVGTVEATELSARLASWHDAMVAHDRKIRVEGADAACDEECPHDDARALWSEALEILGERAHELTFLRSRAEAASGQPVAASGVGADSAHRSRRSTGSVRRAVARRPKPVVDASERPGAVPLDL
jgi:hypothetical protein